MFVINSGKTKLISSHTKELIRQREERKKTKKKTKEDRVEFNIIFKAVRYSIRKDLNNKVNKLIEWTIENSNCTRKLKKYLATGTSWITDLTDRYGKKKTRRDSIVNIATQFFKQLYSGPIIYEVSFNLKFHVDVPFGSIKAVNAME